MTCSRCHAQMIFNYKLGFYGTHGSYCIICGNYEDKVILSNRNPLTQTTIKKGEQVPSYRRSIPLGLK